AAPTFAIFHLKILSRASWNLYDLCSRTGSLRSGASLGCAILVCDLLADMRKETRHRQETLLLHVLTNLCLSLPGSLRFFGVSVRPLSTFVSFSLVGNGNPLGAFQGFGKIFQLGDLLNFCLVISVSILSLGVIPVVIRRTQIIGRFIFVHDLKAANYFNEVWVEIQWVDSGRVFGACWLRRQSVCTARMMEMRAIFLIWKFFNARPSTVWGNTFGVVLCISAINPPFCMFSTVLSSGNKVED
ncbi:hypothetical protein B0H14DRAFT_3644046, partial [Mycena olivaceomarginata]